MAALVVTKKASLLGNWHEDIFTDELLKKIAAHAAAEKGKKAKVKLSGAGLRLTRSRFLQADKSHFYPITAVKTVTRNPHAPRCVMFILADPRRKYQIIAVRCSSEVDAADLVSFTAQVKKDQKVSNVEFKKRDNGNWTLRERSAHNANRHMAELFSQQGNGAAPTTPTSTAVVATANQNGGVHNHVPVLDASRSSVARGSYVKRQFSNSTKKNAKGPDEKRSSEYIIETEVDAEHNGQTDEVKALKGQVSSLTHELHEIKTMLHKTDSTDGKRVQPGHTTVYNSYSAPVSARQEVLPSRPQVHAVTSQHQPVIYRAQSKTYDAKIMGPSASYFADPYAAHRRVSGSFTIPNRLRDRTDSFQGSNKVSFDTESVTSNMSRKSRSLRLYSSIGAIPNTIERSIEDTYARPVTMRRHGSAHYDGRLRPVSYHVMGNNELRVFDAKGRTYDDVAL